MDQNKQNNQGEKFSTFKQFNDRVNNIWNLWKNPLETGLALQDTVFYGGIMFIGINPSAPKGDVDLKGGNVEYKNEQHPIYYYSEKFRDYRYFSKFNDIAEAVDLPWSHIDLFLMRATNQKEIEDIVKSSKDNQFLNEQYLLAKDIIKESKPEIIVVANAYACNLIKDREKENLKLDEDLGIHLIKINGKEVPIFFTSMLTGQRALDNGSFERLKWHIKYVKKERSKKKQ